MTNLDLKIWEYDRSGAQLGLSCADQLKKSRGEYRTVEIDPYKLKDMEKAVERCRAAIENDERIVVFGDYDVDGITATAILVKYFEDIGADVYYKLPNRVADGYGISEDAVTLLKSKNADLIITVDNGISAHSALKLAEELGVDVIVTDHHEPSDELPPAVAVVDPKRHDDESGFDSMCGATVALCLAAALDECNVNELLYIYGDLAAIGTVCDVVDFTDYNRMIVKIGLEMMCDTPSIGLCALLETAKHGENPITVKTLGFTVGPRLNAAGRMDDPTSSLTLMLTDTPDEAFEIAEELEKHNDGRRKEELELVDKLCEEAENLLASPVLVLSGDGLHEGVLGLAASRISRKFNRPTFVISYNGDVGKGSGRSVEGFSLYEALCACKDDLLGFGGHGMAAGLSLNKSGHANFVKSINAHARAIIKTLPIPTVKADGVVVGGMTVEEVQRLLAMGPYGNGYPPPTFVIENAIIENIAPIKDKHCRLLLKYDNNTLWATYFGKTPQTLGFKQCDVIDAIVDFSIYNAGGRESVSTLISQIRKSSLKAEDVMSAKLFNCYLQNIELTEEEKASLRPDRDDIATVYRNIEGVPSSNVTSICSFFASGNVGKIAIAVEALRELGLIREDGGVMGVIKNAARRQLEESEILRGLQ